MEIVKMLPTIINIILAIFTMVLVYQTYKLIKGAKELNSILIRPIINCRFNWVSGNNFDFIIENIGKMKACEVIIKSNLNEFKKPHNNRDLSEIKYSEISPNIKHIIPLCDANKLKGIVDNIPIIELIISYDDHNGKKYNEPLNLNMVDFMNDNFLFVKNN